VNDASKKFEEVRLALAATIPEMTGWWWVKCYHDGRRSVVEVRKTPAGPVVLHVGQRGGDSLDLTLDLYEFLERVAEPS
jgi:hypothetical protein